MSVAPFRQLAELPSTDVRGAAGEGKATAAAPAPEADATRAVKRKMKKKKEAAAGEEGVTARPKLEPASKRSREAIALEVREVRPPRFDLRDPADRERGMAYLALEGYVVWFGVVPREQVAAHLGRLWDYIEAACAGVSRADPTTWTNSRWPSVLAMFIFRFHGIGQSDFMWHIRTLPLVRLFFEEHFRRLESISSPVAASPPPSLSPSSSPDSPSSSSSSCSSSSSSAPAAATSPPSSACSGARGGKARAEEAREEKKRDGAPDAGAPMSLATSFDGCSVLRGAEHKQPFSKSWLHVDENLSQTVHPDYSVQCAVNLLGGTPSTHGGFVVVPRSHTHYKKLHAAMRARAKSHTDGVNERDVADDAAVARFCASKSHFLPIPSSASPIVRPFLSRTGAVRVVALAVEPGDMLSWLSTAVHANTGPTAKAAKTGRKKNKSGTVRDSGGAGGERKVPTTSEAAADAAVVGTLRRVAAFVSMYPKDKLERFCADPDAWDARRREACVRAFTAGHDPVNPAENNASRRGRHPSFAAVATPAACRKTEFTTAERDLL